MMCVGAAAPTHIIFLGLYRNIIMEDVSYETRSQHQFGFFQTK